MNIYILIPPSESKKDGGMQEPRTYNSVTKNLIKSIQHYDGDVGKLLGVKGKSLSKAMDANAAVHKAKTMPAIERYTGVVYDGIGYDTLSKKGVEFANKHLRIISALFGMVAPQECIPDYKLKVDKLYAAQKWFDTITKELEKSYVIDLLPQVHKKALSYNEGITIEFVILKNNKKIPAGHAGKYIKGRFIRWLCEHQITDPKEITTFTEDGFAWDGSCFLKTC